jgi:phosphoribosylglycinamide formyltransferase 1
MARTSPTPKKRVGILISGRGSNMMALVEAARDPAYPVEIVIVISNRPNAAGLAFAASHGIQAVSLDHKRYENRQLFEADMDAALRAANVDLVACAGFMRIMTAEFVERWRDRMLNIHPSLLPSFKGLDTHERALAAGVRIAGCTVHLVRSEMDEGPILAQAAVPVVNGDSAATLAARVLAAEHQIYPQALAEYAVRYGSSAVEKTKLNQTINQADVLFSPPLA